MSEAGTASLVAKPVVAPPTGDAPPAAAEPVKAVSGTPEIKATETLAGGTEATGAAPVEAGDKPAAEAPKVEPVFPDDWREQLAGGDDKKLRQLKRYASFTSFAQAHFALKQRMDAGEFKKGLAQDATPDEIAAFRKDNGIPDKPEGYTMPEGLQIGTEDKPIIENYLKDAHNRNLSPDEVKANVNWFYKFQDQVRAQAAEKDLATRAEAEDTLRGEWGNEYRANINGIKGWLQSNAPDGLYERLLGGRLADGTVLGNDPDVMRWLDARRREENPFATVVGNGKASPLDGIEAELAGLKAKMATKEWFKDEKAQARYRELITAQEKYTAKAA